MKTTVKGRDVALFGEKPAGSGQFVRVGCVGDLSLDIDTESDESTCQDSLEFKEFIPGLTSWTATANLTARQLTDEAAGGPQDAATGISLDELIAEQLAGTVFLIRFSVGVASGSNRYGGNVFITKSGVKGQLKGPATGSVNMQGTGPLTVTKVA